MSLPQIWPRGSQTTSATSTRPYYPTQREPFASRSRESSPQTNPRAAPSGEVTPVGRWDGGWADGQTEGRAGGWARRAGWTDGGARSARCGRTDGTVVLAPLAVDGRTDGRIRMDGPGRIGGWTYGEWTDGWADGQKEGRLDGWAEGGVDGRNGGACSACCGRTDGRLGGWTDGWTARRKDGWNAGWTDGWNGGARSARCGRTIGWADPLAAQDYLYKCDSQSFTPPQKKHQIYRTGLSKVIFLLVILPHLFGPDLWIPRSDDLHSQ